MAPPPGPMSDKKKICLFLSKVEYQNMPLWLSVVCLYLRSTRTAAVCLAAFHPEKAFPKCERAAKTLITKFHKQIFQLSRILPQYFQIWEVQYEEEKDYSIHVKKFIWMDEPFKGLSLSAEKDLCRWFANIFRGILCVLVRQGVTSPQCKSRPEVNNTVAHRDWERPTRYQ